MPRRSAWIVVALVTAVSLCFLLGWTTSSQASTSSSSRPPIRMTRQKTMEDVRPPCPHPIYCSGELLKTVQLSNFYPDAKTFVDMPCAKPVDDVLAAFALLPPNPSHQELAQFLGDNFMPAGSEMETWTPTDWSEKPAYLDNITDPELRRFAAEVNRRCVCCFFALAQRLMQVHTGGSTLDAALFARRIAATATARLTCRTLSSCRAGVSWRPTIGTRCG